MLAGLCKEHGLEVVCEAIVRDSRELTESAIREAMEFADIVVLSGGVSMGDVDFVDTAMGDIGLEVLFNRVAVKPGRVNPAHQPLAIRLLYVRPCGQRPPKHPQATSSGCLYPSIKPYPGSNCKQNQILSFRDLIYRSRLSFTV